MNEVLTLNRTFKTNLSFSLTDFEILLNGNV